MRWLGQPNGRRRTGPGRCPAVLIRRGMSTRNIASRNRGDTSLSKLCAGITVNADGPLWKCPTAYSLRTPGKRADQISQLRGGTEHLPQYRADRRTLEKLNALTVEVHQRIYHWRNDLIAPPLARDHLRHRSSGDWRRGCRCCCRTGSPDPRPPSIAEAPDRRRRA